jgi:hypothetical protein
VSSQSPTVDRWKSFVGNVSEIEEQEESMSVVGSRAGFWKISPRMADYLCELSANDGSMELTSSWNVAAALQRRGMVRYENHKRGCTVRLTVSGWEAASEIKSTGKGPEQLKRTPGKGGKHP